MSRASAEAGVKSAALQHRRALLFRAINIALSRQKLNFDHRALDIVAIGREKGGEEGGRGRNVETSAQNSLQIRSAVSCIIRVKFRHGTAKSSRIGCNRIFKLFT